jgi:two-component system autoinducer 1 sensor kinase/phosphatase LuxN
MAAAIPTGVRIGVADDREDQLRALRALLTALGHHVVCAVENGAELIKHCRGQDVDLVIVDLEMPVIDGLEAAELLAAQGIPAILLSGHPDATEVNLDHEPVAARLMKPATVDSLQAAISRVLALRQL